ncbi:hypothetical protein [Capillimicrobium parvum]|uniref:hypothetical protein n=1 Tax=Capillimicrobium parvum TaxID=2884022 RepID=UPI00216AC1F0|nr:hypothetical protein [Capillimicrobium parvum]
MESALEVVVIGVVALSALIGVATFAARSSAYDEIGRGGLSIDRPPPGPVPASGMVRDAEIRQMLEAANDRRIRRGEAPRDVEAELARLTRPAVDPQLESEVRSLVVASNERRERRGEAPLDVEAEVRRQLEALS